MSRPEPTGENRIVEPEEIFFSTTDAKGVIEKANSVFVDISRYSWDDLIGAPHNIISSPDDARRGIPRHVDDNPNGGTFLRLRPQPRC